MKVLNKLSQDLSLIHNDGSGDSVTLRVGIVENVKDKFADLPIFKEYKKSGYIVVSGDKTDEQDDVNKEQENFTKEKIAFDIPDEVKRDIKKYCITYGSDITEDGLINLLKTAKEEYNDLTQKLNDLGAKPHHLSNLDTLRNKYNELIQKD